MWYLNLFQQLRIYQQCMAMLIRKLWSHIKFWDAPSFQTYSLMWVPWICSPKSPGFQPSHLWGFYKSSLFLSCFHPQRHSRSSSSPGTVVLSCRDGQSFHQSRGYWSQKRAIKASIIGIWDMELRWEYMYFWNNVCIFVFFLVSNFPIFGDSINHPCFCHVSTRNDTPGPPPLLVQWYSPAAMARVFINPVDIQGLLKPKKGL